MTPALVFAAAIPGFLVSFIVFLETQMTCLACTSPEYKLRKTGGFHWNLLVVDCLVLICSALGIPWLCGTHVPSLSHTQSLLKINRKVAPGEKPIIEGVHEQRLTSVFAHLLLGLSFTPPMALLLSQIPVAAVMGVFFYLGFCNIQTLQFSHRSLLLFIPPKHHPDDEAYVRRVPTRRMHAFTAIQLACFGLLVVCKMTKAGIAFPLFVALMVPLREYGLTKLFSVTELNALDANH